MKKLLFASPHCCIDPSSGAALATRDVLECLAERGWDCRAITCGLLDFAEETRIEDVLAAHGAGFERRTAALPNGWRAEVFDLSLNGVRVAILPTASSRAEHAPSHAEALAFLGLAEPLLDRFKPDMLLTYGGHPVNLELMKRARARGIRVVFHLHNFAYRDAQAFEHATAVLTPSEFSARWYRERIGIACTSISYPIRPERVVVPRAERAPRYVTFVNPERSKGSPVFARIAHELNRGRPEIPLLVVEGRRRALDLGELGLDLSGLSNVNRMTNTGDPRDFWRVTRMLLMPSLWRESFGRVAVEAMMNGIPVLASDRGALPETLGDSGFLFTIAERHAPASGTMPSVRDTAPWRAMIERLWDDPSFETRHCELSRREAERYQVAAIAERYERWFADGSA